MNLQQEAAAYGLIKVAKKEKAEDIVNKVVVDHRPDRIAKFVNGLTAAGARLGLLGGSGYGLYRGVKAIPDLVNADDGVFSNLGSILGGLAWRTGAGAGLGALGGGGLGHLIGRAVSPIIR